MFFLRHSYYSIAEVLDRRFPYYQQLSEADKDKFLKRLLRFLHDKSFEGRQGLVVTEEMEVLISATAIQLTFGLKEYLLPFFSEIVLYPGIYYSELGHNYHKGETSSLGAVVFSWADFEEGLADPHDRLNLGLHEWAHALMLENQMGSGWDSLFRDYYNRWRFEAQDEFEALEDHYSEVFRSYGGTNIGEFFAVSVEVFFEAPELFQQKAPTLFHHLCVLLNQYPLGREAESEASVSEHTPPDLVLKADKSDHRRYILYASTQVLFIFATLGNRDLLFLWLFLFGFLLCYSFLYWRNQSIQKRSILLYPGHMEVQDNSGRTEALFDYEHLAGLEIKPKGSKYDIAFVFPVKGEVFDSNFRFSFDDEQIAELRKALREKNLPTKVLLQTS